MNSAFRRIALIGKYRSPEIAGPLLGLAAYLTGRGCEVMIEEATAAAVGSNGYGVAGYDAIGAAAVEQYHVTQAISRLELALTALRAVAKGVV